MFISLKHRWETESLMPLLPSLCCTLLTEGHNQLPVERADHVASASGGFVCRQKKSQTSWKKVCKQYSKAGLLPVLIPFQERAEQISRAWGPQGAGQGEESPALLPGEIYSLLKGRRGTCIRFQLGN